MHTTSLFITGTDTDVGKTTIAKWLCYHLGYSYFKPIQTGDESDTLTVDNFSLSTTYKPAYSISAPLCPWHAAHFESRSVDMTSITLPQDHRLIVEGAGGVLVPLSESTMMVDFIKQLDLPVIVVARSTIGTLNHTFLTLEALRARDILICGVILSGPKNSLNKSAIEQLGKVEVLDELEFMDEAALKNKQPSTLLQKIESYELLRI